MPPRSWPEISSASARKSAVEAVRSSYRSTQVRSSGTERLVADLHGQGVERQPAAEVDGGLEQLVGPGVAGRHAEVGAARARRLRCLGSMRPPDCWAQIHSA